MPDPVLIARCPEHGLHGERSECFVCGGPVEQVPMVPAEVTDAMVERAACALINADAREPYDRPQDDWRPAAVARAVLEAGLHGKETPDAD